MKFINLKYLSSLTAMIIICTASVFAQDAAPPQSVEQTNPPKTSKKSAEKNSAKVKEGKDTSNKEIVSQNEENNITADQSGSSDDDEQIKNYYVNYLKEYRLGPEDVISVEVFGQPNYSKAGISIPPTAVISYQLIPGGVFVGGKTTDQVSKEIAKKLDEYIIDPQVTVTLEKVGSARYAVMGDVTQPGVRLMTRRITALTALMEAGGVLSTGSKKKAVIYRNNGMGGYSQVAVNLDDVEKGKAKDVEIQPGDQVFIPGNKMKTFNNILEIVSKASSFRLLFGLPF